MDFPASKDTKAKATSSLIRMIFPFRKGSAGKGNESDGLIKGPFQLVIVRLMLRKSGRAIGLLPGSLSECRPVPALAKYGPRRPWAPVIPALAAQGLKNWHYSGMGGGRRRG